MAFWEDFSKKVKDVAAVTGEKAKDVAAAASEKAKETAELTKINIAIAGEQRDIDKNYRTIGEWFATEFQGEIPEEVKPLLDAVKASKAKIAELEASKPSKDASKPDAEEDVAEETAEKADFADEDDGITIEATIEVTASAKSKKCPICGLETDSRFCPQCGAPMGD